MCYGAPRPPRPPPPGSVSRQRMHALPPHHFAPHTRRAPVAPSRAGVRKHCRKSHPEWLREVDLDKANLGCRWAARPSSRATRCSESNSKRVNRPRQRN